MKIFVNLQSLNLKHDTFPNLNHCLITPFIRSYTTKKMIPTNVDSSDFKISFLKDKCGLSGKPLIRACKCLDFDSSDQTPNEVLELFRNFGFPQPNITRILSSYPFILRNYHPQQVLKPKLHFLLSISQSQTDVVAIVTKCPVVLTKSLDKYLKPTLNLLNSVTGSYPNTVSVLKINPFILSQNIPKSFLLNTRFLLTLGVPNSHILKLLRTYGQVLGTPHGKVRDIVSKLTDMGFNLKSSYFLHALHALAFNKKTTWESRCVLFRSFGFSDHEILSMFKKLPQIMCYSDMTINGKMGFFLNKLHWTPSRLSSYPTVLAYSLEKRTIPRCSVLQVLVSKNGTSKIYTMSTIFVMAERKFIEEFVAAHKDKVPEVMEAYKGKLRFDKYTFQQK